MFIQIDVKIPENIDFRSVLGFPRNRILPVTLFENMFFIKEKDAIGIKKDQQKKVNNGIVSIRISERNSKPEISFVIMVMSKATITTKNIRINLLIRFNLYDTKPEMMNPTARLI